MWKPEYGKHWVEKRVKVDSEYHRKRHLRRRYGMSIDEFEKLANRQKGRCGICLKRRRLVVDHDHDEGFVRGLLCHHCNSALHIIEDNALLASAKRYLRSKVTRTYTYTGKAKWAMLFKPDEKYGTYKITLYPDKAGLKQYIKVGHQGEVKEDEDGKFVTFRRKPQVLTKKGTIWELGPPVVVGDDNEPIDQLVGNGSKVEVTVETYNTAKGLGTRLAKVKVLELREYNPENV